jgi:hypothetical protein
MMIEEVATLLVGASAIDMVSESGKTIEIWTISSDGASIRASAPRLEVFQGMRLECRLLVGGLPHRVMVVVEDATVQSERRAALRLRVAEVTADGSRRGSERIEVHVAAEMIALVCDRIVPADRLVGHVVDLSVTGIAISVSDTRIRAGDLMRLHARFLEGPITTEVRVKRTFPTDTNTVVAGCAFASPAPETQQTVQSVLARLRKPGTQGHR